MLGKPNVFVKKGLSTKHLKLLRMVKVQFLPFSSFCEELASSAISKTMINMNSIFLSAYPTTSKDDELSGSQDKQISAIDSSNSGQISRIISSKVT